MATHSSVLAWRIPGTGDAWWAAVYGVAQSRARLKGLSSSSRVITGGGLCNYGGQEDSSYLTTNLHVVRRYLVDVIKFYSQVILGKKYYSSYGTGLDSVS